MTVVLMALAGGLGAVARFLVDSAVRARLATPYPVGTSVVNLVGSLLLGGLTAATLRQGVHPDVLLVLGTGFCGGFTTFSTAMVECVRLIQQGRPRLALGYLVASAAGCLMCAATGFWLVVRA